MDSSGSGRSAPRRRLGFAAQMLVLQLVVVALVVLGSAAVYGWLTYQRLGIQAENQALAVARSVAASPDVRAEVARLTAAEADRLPPAALADGPLMALAEEVRVRTDSLFVVVTDDAGIRLAHPDPGALGQRVSTDPTEALAGREVTAQEEGTLGHSARAKVPVYAPGGDAVVGEVSVGYSSEDVLENLGRNIVPITLTAAAALGLGAAASWLLARRLRRLTLGLEPEEIGTLVQDQEAVLRGVDEGVIGVSADRRITVVNREAQRLLDIADPGEIIGTPLAQAGLPASFLHLIEQATPESPALEQVVGPRVLILSARTVQPSRAGTALGWVLMLRDRTELQSLTRQLDAVGALTTALRAQRHEFANRLHTVAGLLSIGDYEAAEDYVSRIVATGPLKYPAEQAELLRDPYLQAFIGAKSVEAAERGVVLRIGPETLIRGRITEAQDVTTVIGNLLDNAVQAAVRGSSTDRWVEVEAMDEQTDRGGILHLVVADSGDGVEEPERIFAEGYSTAESAPFEPQGHGIGLHLCRQIARRGGGDVWVASPGRPGGPGAVFCARLPGTVAPAEDAYNAEGGTGQGTDEGVRRTQ